MYMRKKFKNLNLQYNTALFSLRDWSSGDISLQKSLIYVYTGGFWLPLNFFYCIFFRQQFQTFPKHSGGQVVLKTVIFVFPVSIIVIKVGDVFLLQYSNIFTQQNEIENEMFLLLSFKFLLWFFDKKEL